MSDTNTQPTQLGRYQVTGVLGKGAMGTVYSAIDTVSQEVVALKTINTDEIDEEQMAEVLTRFQREAEVMAGVRHPNIVNVIEFGEDQEVPYIAMELIEGRELQDYIKAGTDFDLRQVRRIIRQVLDALGFVHEQGICHRDLKPANIILHKDGSVKIADFGVARVASSNLTQIGAVLGSPHYMSPEQITGLRVDTRADLYSIGVILYELLTGRKPLTGKTFQAMLYAVTSAIPEPPTHIRPELPPVFDILMEKALAKRPDDRFQTAADFIDALEKAVRGETAASLMLDNTRSIFDAIDEQSPDGGAAAAKSVANIMAAAKGTTTASGEDDDMERTMAPGAVANHEDMERTMAMPSPKSRPATSPPKPAVQEEEVDPMARTIVAAPKRPSAAEFEAAARTPPPEPQKSHLGLYIGIAVAALLLVLVGVGGAFLFMSAK
jgi:serine/threonine-protein kinase